MVFYQNDTTLYINAYIHRFDMMFLSSWIQKIKERQSLVCIFLFKCLSGAAVTPFGRALGSAVDIRLRWASQSTCNTKRPPAPTPTEWDINFFLPPRGFKSFPGSERLQHLQDVRQRRTSWNKMARIKPPRIAMKTQESLWGMENVVNRRRWCVSAHTHTVHVCSAYVVCVLLQRSCYITAHNSPKTITSANAYHTMVKNVSTCVCVWLRRQCQHRLL